MRCGNFLDPPQVNGIVHMILLVYVFGQNCDSDFKNSAGHKGLQFTSPLSAVILSEALQRNAKHEARLSKISVVAPLLRQPQMIRDGKPGLAPKAFGAALQLRFAQNDNY